MTYGLHELHEHPSESMNWRRHRSGCPNYRERWFPQSDTDAGEPMYQVFCLLNTPPETFEEQEKCLASRGQCWRLAETVESKRRSARSDIPLSSVKRRKPA
ncbi:MAG: hypothetical protein ACXVCO_03185 [Ktedonobacterales bacterium]